MKSNFFHGIMFHNFHDNKNHIKLPGSISRYRFEKLIKKVGIKNILNAENFYEKLKNKKLKKNHRCLTFDDGIKSQIDIALPILNKFKIKAFFFIYSSIFTNKPDYLEVYRYFRAKYFKHQNDFYNLFYKMGKINKNVISNKYKKLIKEKSRLFPFYSTDDIIFRIVRDEILSKRNYAKIMDELFLVKKFHPQKIIKKIFFDKKDVFRLIKDGHTVGLHSHSHPTLMEKKKINFQFKEYKYCKQILKKKFNLDAYSMSHPNGSYNKHTLKILRQFDIQLGFKQTLKVEKKKGMKKVNNSDLEVARVDHTNLLKSLKI